MGYVGNQTTNAYTSLDKQTITGDGGASYTLDHAVANANEIEVFVNNVRQEPSVAYTVSGTALTMTGNVAASDDFYVVFQGKAVGTVVPPDDSVTTARINDDAVTTAKIADDAVTSAKLADSAVTSAKLPAGTVLQVKTAQKTDKDSFTGTGYSAISDLSVSITPSSTSSKILVTVSLAFGCGSGDRISFTALRGSTNLANHSSTLSNRTPAFFGVVPNSSNDLCNGFFSTLDSPSTTSATTYSVSGRVTGGTAYINASFNDTDSAVNTNRGVSSITVMEIAG